MFSEDTIEIEHSHEGTIAVSCTPKCRVYKNTGDVPAIQISIVTTDGHSVHFDKRPETNGHTGLEVDLHFHPAVFIESE